MADITWFKLTTNFFDDEKIRIIESMPERDTILVIWIRLIAMASKVNDNGWIYVQSKVPYTVEDLASVMNRPLKTVQMALSLFQRYKMIEVAEDDGILLLNFLKHQNIDALERIRNQARIRVAKHREKQKLLTQGNVTVTFGNAIEKRREEYIREDEKENGEIKKIWCEVLEILKTRINDANYRTWLEKTEGILFKDGEFIVGTPSSYVSEYLRKNQLGLIENVLAKIIESDVHVTFTEVEN